MGARTLFLGYDGQDSSLIDLQITEGGTPRIAALAQRLARAPVRNYPGFGDGAFWTSAATGADPSWHGDYFILQFDPATYTNYWFDEAVHCKRPAFWQALDAEGRRVCVVDWPHGPFNRIKNGVLIDNWLQHDHTMPSRSYPEHYIEDLHAKYGHDPFAAGLHAIPLKDVETAKWAIDTACTRIATKAEFCVEQLSSGEWDFFSVAFSEIHDIAHYAYHLHDPAHPDYDRAFAEALGDPLRPIGEATDRAFGAIIDAAGPDCEIMMVAGIGLMPLVTGNHALDLIAERLDVGLAAEEAPTRKARDVYRAKIPLPIRQALSPLKRFLLRQPEHPELAMRRFFPVLNVHSAGCLRLNVEGREKHGVVAPGEDYKNLVDQLADDLMQIRNADTGEAVIDSVVKTYEAYNGLNIDMLPDILINWRRDRPWRRITSPKIGVIEIVQEEMRTGDHRDVGEFWASPESLRRCSEGGELKPEEIAAFALASARRGKSAGAALTPALG